jgi:hypothetical protein
MPHSVFACGLAFFPPQPGLYKPLPEVAEQVEVSLPSTPSADNTSFPGLDVFGGTHQCLIGSTSI